MNDSSGRQWIIATVAGLVLGGFVAVVFAASIIHLKGSTAPLSFAAYNGVRGACLGLVMGAVQWLVLRKRTGRVWLWSPASGLILGVTSFMGVFVVLPVLAVVFGVAAAADGTNLVVDNGTAVFWVALFVGFAIRGIFIGTCLGVGQAFLLFSRGDAIQSWTARTAIPWCAFEFATASIGVILVVNDLPVAVVGAIDGLLVPAVLGLVLGVATRPELPAVPELAAEREVAGA